MVFARGLHVHHKQKNYLIKRAQKLQEGKWEDLWTYYSKSSNFLGIAPNLWKCSVCFNLPLKLNIFTNSDRYPGRLKYSPTIRIQRTTQTIMCVSNSTQLFPPPTETYVSPLQMGEDLSEHWSSEIQINDLWDSPQTFDRIVKCHSGTGDYEREIETPSRHCLVLGGG
jgi:hypothetical protein